MTGLREIFGKFRFKLLGDFFEILLDFSESRFHFLALLGLHIFDAVSKHDAHSAFRGTHAAVAMFEGAVRICPTLEEALDGARAALIVTRWPEFRRLPEILDGMADPPVVVDGRRMLDKERIERYEGIGL